MLLKCSVALRYILYFPEAFFSFEKPLVLGFFKSSLVFYKVFTQLVTQALYPSGIITAQRVHPMI